MPPRSLTINDTAPEVALCDWHLRKIFREEDFMGRLAANDFMVGASTVRERKHPSANAPSIADAPYVQEFILVDVATNQEVARCHQFLKPDKITAAASGKPDPKEIYWKGQNYRQLGKRNPECEHCKAGISTY